MTVALEGAGSVSTSVSGTGTGTLLRDPKPGYLEHDVGAGHAMRTCAQGILLVALKLMSR